MDSLTASKVYENLCREYSAKTMVIVSNDAFILQPSDNVIILKEGRLAEAGRYQMLLEDPHSLIHQLINKVGEE